MKREKPDPYLLARDKIMTRLQNLQFEGVTPEERIFILAHTLKAQVDNGGFDQFFFNSSGDYAAETIEALEKIGAMRTKCLLIAAQDVFPEGKPPKDIVRRRSLMEQFSDGFSKKLESLDSQFYKSDEDMDELLLRYVEEHQTGFPDE